MGDAMDLEPGLFSSELQVSPLTAAFFGLSASVHGPSSAPGTTAIPFRWVSQLVASRDDLARHSPCPGYFFKLFLHRFVRVTVAAAGCARLCRIIGFEPSQKGEYAVPVGHGGSVKTSILLRVFDYSQAAHLLSSPGFTGNLAPCLYILPIANVSSQAAKRAEAEALVAALKVVNSAVIPAGEDASATSAAFHPLSLPSLGDVSPAAIAAWRKNDALISRALEGASSAALLPSRVFTLAFARSLVREGLRILADQRAGMAAAVWSPTITADVGGSSSGIASHPPSHSWRFFGQDRGHGVLLVLRSWLVQDALQERLFALADDKGRDLLGSSEDFSMAADDDGSSSTSNKKKKEKGGEEAGAPVVIGVKRKRPQDSGTVDEDENDGEGGNTRPSSSKRARIEETGEKATDSTQEGGKKEEGRGISHEDGYSAVFKRAIIGDENTDTGASSTVTMMTQEEKEEAKLKAFHRDERVPPPFSSSSQPHPTTTRLRPGYGARDQRPLGKGGRGIGPDGRGFGPGRVAERTAGQYRFVFLEKEPAEGGGGGGRLSLPFIPANSSWDEYRPEVTAWRGLCQAIIAASAGHHHDQPGSVVPLTLEAFSTCVLAQVDLLTSSASSSSSSSSFADPARLAVNALSSCPASLPSGYPYPASVEEAMNRTQEAMKTGGGSGRGGGGGASAASSASEAPLVAEKLPSLAAGGTRKPTWPFDSSSPIPNPPPTLRRYASPVQCFVIDLDAVAIAVAKERLAAKEKGLTASAANAEPEEREEEEEAEGEAAGSGDSSSSSSSSATFGDRAILPPPKPARLHLPDCSSSSLSSLPSIRGAARMSKIRPQPYAAADALSAEDKKEETTGDWRQEASHWLLRLFGGPDAACWWLSEDELTALTVHSSLAGPTILPPRAPAPPALLSTDVARRHQSDNAAATGSNDKDKESRSLDFFSVPPAHCFRSWAASPSLRRGWARYLRSEDRGAEVDPHPDGELVFSDDVCPYPALDGESASLLLQLSGLRSFCSHLTTELMAAKEEESAPHTTGVPPLPRGSSYGLSARLSASTTLEQDEEDDRIKRKADLIIEEARVEESQKRANKLKLDPRYAAELEHLRKTAPITDDLPPATVLYECLVAADALNGFTPIPEGPTGGVFRYSNNRKKQEGEGGGDQSAAPAVPAMHLSGHANRAPWPLLSSLALPPATTDKSSLPWVPGPLGSRQAPHSAHSLVHPTFFTSFLPWLLARFGLRAAQRLSAGPDLPSPFSFCLDACWLRCVFPCRKGAFLAGMFHGTAPSWGEKIAETGFFRAICRMLRQPSAPTSCPSTEAQAKGSDKAWADHVRDAPERGFGAGRAERHALLYGTLPTICSCHLPAAGHQCNCNMMGFGAYLADRAYKADHFAVMRGEQRSKEDIERKLKGEDDDAAASAVTAAAATAATVTTGARLTCVVDVGHAKVGTSCPCLCGCGKGFVDHVGCFYSLQGFDSLYLRDGSLPATRNREWAVADPLRVDVVQLTYVSTTFG